MKKRSQFIILLLFFFFTAIVGSQAQCSICTKTAQQMGEGPARGLNGGILYLAAAPLLILGFIGYKWYQSNRGS
jgi:UPF0716 family protein affecting phage T7 exclusion